MDRRRVVAALLVVLAVVGATGPAWSTPSDVDDDGVPNRRDLCRDRPGPRADGCPTAIWQLSDLDGPPPADWTFAFGSLGWKPVAGDWGHLDSVGGFDPSTGTWHLRDSICDCSAVRHFRFDVVAPGRHLPIAGDWDGDGVDGVGLYTPRTGTFHLRNSLSAGAPDLVFAFGGPQPPVHARPVAGDWDGDGDATVGLFRPDTGRWRLRNTNDAGPADLLFVFHRDGVVSEWPVTGDWDGNGTDTVGYLQFHRLFHLRNANSAGPADQRHRFGNGHWPPVAGDWDAEDGRDTIGFQGL